jgi:hypothetical protein
MVGSFRIQRRSACSEIGFDHVGDDGARLDKVECCDGRIHLVETFAAAQKLGVDSVVVRGKPGLPTATLQPGSIRSDSCRHRAGAYRASRFERTAAESSPGWKGLFNNGALPTALLSSSGSA